MKGSLCSRYVYSGIYISEELGTKINPLSWLPEMSRILTVVYLNTWHVQEYITVWSLSILLLGTVIYEVKLRLVSLSHIVGDT